MQNEDVLAVRRRTDALITAETQQQAVANQTANYTFLKIVICLFFFFCTVFFVVVLQLSDL